MADQRPTSTSLPGPTTTTTTTTAYHPVPTLDNDSDHDHDHVLDAPRAPYLSSSDANPASLESPRGSYIQRDSLISTPRDSQTLLPTKTERDYDRDSPCANDDLPRGVSSASSPASKRRRRRLLPLTLALLALIIIIILAVILPVYFTVIKPRNNRNSSPHATSNSNPGFSAGASPSSTASGASPTSTPLVAEAITGGNGSTVKGTNGTAFVYTNSFGGIWYSDPNDPYNNNAYPNSWTPPLNQSWDYTNNRIYGVNLGGWFVLEPFISPALFQKYPGAVDEWTLSVAMRADTTVSGGINQIEEHYKTFITEQDFAQIAAAGLNWIRLPIPYWAIEVWDDEPFLAKVCWTYIVQAFQWARKYGLRVNLDLHTIPGSQNGFNHSGKDGSINFLSGTMGMANAQRALNYIRIITEFISQPEYRDVVPMFGIMNEPKVDQLGSDTLRGFYVEAYNMVRGITGVGAGKGPFIAFNDGLVGVTGWGGFMTGADRIVLDTHPYFAFNGQPATAPIDTGTGAGAGGTWPKAACDAWTPIFNTSRNTFGPTIAGEWSNGYNDCGLFLRGVGGKPSFGGNCDDWQDASQWTAGTKAGLKAFGAASMDSLIDWFFWTWKIGDSQKGIVESPLWSYKAGLSGGWILTDPRQASGACGPPKGDDAFTGYQPWMTGGAGAGNIAAAQTTPYPYPPADLQGTPVDQLPLYTSTGSIITLPAPTFTGTAGTAIGTANGWFNTNDAAPGPTKIPSCAYPNAWDAQNAAIPTGCSGGANAAVPPAITPPPSRQ